MQSQIQSSLITMNPPSDPILAIEKLRQTNPDTTFIRFQWIDYSGVLRAKILVLETVLALVGDGKVLHTPPISFHSTVDELMMRGVELCGVHWLIPDWSSLKQSARPGTATVMCGVSETTPSCPLPNGDLCPRQALVRVLRKAKETYQLDFLVGFGLEFQVMKLSHKKDAEEEGPLAVPYSRGLGGFAVSGLLDPCWGYVEESVQHLRTLGVQITSLHTEGSQRGQYEIALGPLPPLQAVDQLVLVHSVLKQIFSNHGCMVTMSPVPTVNTGQGSSQMNGLHMHVSLQPTRLEQEESFLAGMLKRLPSLCAFLLPLEVSYQRLGQFLLGDCVAWGTENRTVPIRKIGTGHWEIRLTEATANMYLALAAVLSAGMLGLEGREPLTWPNLQTVPDEKKVQLLPRSMYDSLLELESGCRGLDVMLGERLVRHYIELKRHELALVKKMGDEKARQLLIERF